MSKKQCANHNSHEYYTDSHRKPVKVEPTSSLHPEAIRLIIAPPEILPVVVLVLNATQPRITYKQEEISVVVQSNTILSPYAMMIELINTATALRTV
jgi:hypothetical protein